MSKFVRDCSLVGRYFYNVYIEKFEIVFSLNVKDNNICPFNIILEFHITYKMLQCFASLNVHV